MLTSLFLMWGKLPEWITEYNNKKKSHEHILRLRVYALFIVVPDVYT